MAIKLPDSPRKKRAVNLLLYEADLRELKRRAKEIGQPYQQYLRNLVHEALRLNGKVL